MPDTPQSTNQWRFFRAGGFDQVKLETGSDLLTLDQLDLKLWVALACPTSGLEFDTKTLSLIDSDKDGRIRAPELIAAVKWAGALLKNPDELMRGSPTLPLNAINQASPEGGLILKFAQQVLGKAETDQITVEEASTAAATFAAKPFNGDGIVPVDSADDAPTKLLINDIINCLGADNDASGKPGVGQAKVDQFFTQATAFSDWWKGAESDSTTLPLGLNTPAAASAVKAVRTKVEDYFARCRLAAFDTRAIGALNREEKEFAAFSAKDLTVESAEIAGFPLARVAPGEPLPLQEGVNPAWSNAMAAFQANAVKPLLGDKTRLTEAEWKTITGKLAKFETWNGTKVGGSVEKLGLPRVREILSGKGRADVNALIAKDKTEEAYAKAIGGLQRLVLYNRDLNRLCHNFVSFQDFYGRREKAIFQAGTLYLDQRSCDLCLTVEDAAKHASMAALAGTYLAYCDCARKATSEKMQIVAAFTGGDSDNLMVGRNGIFFDRKGKDWDATITKIIDNPISIRQAFFAPYKKLVRMIEEQVAKRAAAADAAADAKLAQTAQVAAGTHPPPATPPTPPVTPPKVDTGTLAAIGLVLTTLLAALGGIFGKIAGLTWWQIPLALLALLLIVSTPSMVMAYLKLRRRNLGPILDANGWAVNAKAKMNVPFGGSLTAIATLPPGSQRDMVDPYAEKKSPWPKVIIVLVILAIAYLALDKLGFLYEWTNGRLGTPIQHQTPAEPPKPA
jgi:hypothetical protein